MKLINAISYCFLMLVLGSSCNRNVAPQATLPVRSSNSQYTVEYNITNDERNIYIQVVTIDPEMKRRITKAGMRLYFDPKGKMKKKMALVYPQRNMDGVKIPPVYSTEGFLNMANGQHNLTDKLPGIQVGLQQGSDSGLVYEAVVPIDKVLGHGLTEKSFRKDFSVGFVVNQLPGRHGRPGEGDGGQRRGGGGGFRPSISVGGGVGSFGMGGGMGMGVGFGGGGMRGGGPGRGGTPGDQEEVSWVNFRFSGGEKK